MQNRRLELTGLGELGKSRRLTGTGSGLACQEAAGQVFGRVWNQTDPFLWSKPGPLAGYSDPLLTLAIRGLERESPELPPRRLQWWARRSLLAFVGSVSNGSWPSLWVRVRVQTEPLPNWRSGLSIKLNCQLGYGLIGNSQPIWIGRVVSGSPSGSIDRFN